MFTLNGGTIVWRSVKQSYVFDSVIEVEYVAALEGVKEAVWFCNFLRDLDVIPNFEKPMVVYCNNSDAVTNSKEPRSHQKGKKIERKFNLIREIVERGDMTVYKIKSENNLVDPFTKTLSSRVF